MNSNKKYIHSFFSILCVIAWAVLVVVTFYSEKSDRWLTTVPVTYLITIAGGIIGGSVLILVRTIKKTKLQHGFIYNLFGTFNIVVGFFGLVLSTSRIESPLYTISASFAVGLFIYHDIYFRKNTLV